MKRILLLLASLLASLASTPANAQSACAALADHAVPTAAQWAACFTSKQDFLGSTPVLPSNILGGAPIVVTPSGIFVSISIANGTSVVNPSTGTLEQVIPMQTTTAASKTFGAADLYKETRRSNGGSAMTDTFPASSTTGLVNGTRIVIANFDVTGTDTITAGAGTTINGGASDPVGPGRAIAYVYDAPATQWRRTLNTGSALLSANNLSDIASAATARTNLAVPGLGTANTLTALNNFTGGLQIGGTAVTLPIPVAIGGSGQATAAAARSSSGFNIDACTSTGDANYTILATDRCVYRTALTAPRTDTLPAANSVNAGQIFYFMDFRGLVTGTNTITIARSGADTINGGTSTIALNAAFGAAIYWSDGSSRWTFFTLPSAGGSGSVTAGAGGIVPTSGSPATLFVEQMNPGGRITVASGVCAPTTDQVAQTSIFYAPCGGQWIPVYDGTDMKLRKFTSSDSDTVGLTLALGSNWAANTIYSGFVGLNGGTVTFCTGPAWTNSGVGTSTRGTGAGTSQISIFKGLWTNTVSMTCRLNNTTTFTCAVNQCTYVGDFMTNGSAGQIDLKFGTAAAGCGQAFLSVFNAYNRKLTRASLSNTTASWTYTSSTWRQQNASTTCNVQAVIGVPEETYLAENQVQVAVTASGAAAYVGVGINSSAALASRATGAITIMPGGATSSQGNSPSVWRDALPVGLNQIVAIEKADNVNAATYVGSTASFNLTQLSFEGNM